MTQAVVALPVDTVAKGDPSLKRVEIAPRARTGSGSDATVRALPKPRKQRRVPFWTLAIAGAVIGTVAYVYVPQTFVVETDDASFQADTVPVVPKVAAYVSALHVTDNRSFSAGQLLVELDPRDYEAAAGIATANLKSAQAAEGVAEAQLTEQSQVISSDETNVEGDRGTLDFAKQQLDRYTQLASTGTGTIQRAQQAQSDFTERRAALQRDTATLGAARAQSAVLQSQVEQARANVVQAQAALDQAKLNLSYTKIYAPMAGTVANRSVQVGTCSRARCCFRPCQTRSMSSPISRRPS
jgi:membrane fusion protein, multidrug efflux system